MRFKRVAPPPLAALGLLSDSSEPPFRRPAKRSAASPFGRVPLRRADPSRWLPCEKRPIPCACQGALTGGTHLLLIYLHDTGAHVSTGKNHITNIRRYKEGVIRQKLDGSVICEITVRHSTTVILDFRQQNWRRSH